MRAFERLICLVILAALPACQSAPPTRGTSRPNILFIMADDHATAAASCYGSRINQTPRIDQLARSGMRFDRAYCTNAICGPSRAVILTGKHGHRNGVLDNSRIFDGSQVTLPKLFSASGYQTALVGKWHLISEPTGFDHWIVLPGQGHYYNPDVIEMGKRRRLEGYVTDLVTDLAIDWMEERDPDRPFFMMLHHKAPHRNWMPAPRHLGLHREEQIPVPDTLFDAYASRSAAARDQELSIARDLRPAYDLKSMGEGEDGYSEEFGKILERLTPAQRRDFEAACRAEDRARPRPADDKERVRWRYQRYIKDYLRCIASLDENIGRVLDWLDEAGLAEDTLVVYTSDQGFFLGEHGWFDKRFMYEESMRMPLIMRYPGRIEANESTEALVSNLDLAPTLLDFANLSAPADMQGLSFRSLAEGDDHAVAARDSVYYHYFEYPGIHAVKRHYGIRTDRYKLMHFYHDIDAWELYDLQVDPEELRNVYDDPRYRKQRADLHARLTARQQEYGDRPEDFRGALLPQRIDHLAKGVAVSWRNAPSPPYRRDMATILTDGLFRERGRYSGRSFEGQLGFREQAVVATLSFDQPVAAKRIALHLLHDPPAWIHFPDVIRFSASDDGEDFEVFARDTIESPGLQPETRFFAVSGPARPFRHLRVEIDARKVIPRGLPGAGEQAWVFIDEIVVE